MATEVTIPDLGEGIEDVTVSRWRVKVGDQVNEGDVIVEIATDKVDTEVPSPASGTVLKLGASEGDIVPLTQVLAVIGAEGESVEDAPASGGSKAEKTPEDATDTKVEPAETETPVRNEENVSTTTPATEVTVNGAGGSTEGADVKASPVAKRVAADKGVDLGGVSGTGPGGRITKDDVLASSEKKPAGGEVATLPGDLADEASLAVRRLAAEHNINLREISGGKALSALTRYDVLSAVATRDSGESVTVEPKFAPPAGWTQAAAAPEKSVPEKGAPPVEKAAQKGAAKSAPAEAAAGEELVKHSRMRSAVARTTTQSAFTAPHVTTMWDVEMTAVLAHRAAHKKEFAAQGVNLTITAYFFEAAVAALRTVPAANASWTDEGVIIKRQINLGMATALPADQYGMGGLIVPVIKNAGELNLLGIARAVNELAEKARGNQLRPDDLADGTFTISNYGTSGSRFQTPIIVQPQVGILGVGAVEKRAIVVSAGHPLEANVGDYLTFRPMTTLGFSYDHRVLDGATADAFCAAVKKFLEEYK